MFVYICIGRIDFLGVNSLFCLIFEDKDLLFFLIVRFENK